MRLTTKGRYAVMAMVDLAKHSDGEPVALADVVIGRAYPYLTLSSYFKIASGRIGKKCPGAGWRLLAIERPEGADFGCDCGGR